MFATLLQNTVSERFSFATRKESVYLPTFNLMFCCNQMQEKYENVFNIPNISLHTLGNLLDFIYTGCFKENGENVCQLLEAADYVQITGNV